MNIFFLLSSMLFFLHSLRFSYFWWFQSKEYVDLNVKKRKEYRNKLFFMPQILLFGFYDKNPKFEVWINRIVGLTFLVFSVLGIFVGINGPFVPK
jgi:hypothetical protein